MKLWLHHIPAGRSGVGKPWSGVGSPALDILGLKQVLDTDKDWNFRTVHATQLAHRKCMVNKNFSIEDKDVTSPSKATFPYQAAEFSKDVLGFDKTFDTSWAALGQLVGWAPLSYCVRVVCCTL